LTETLNENNTTCDSIQPKLISKSFKVGEAWDVGNGIDGSKFDAFDSGLLLFCSAYGQPRHAPTKLATSDPAEQSQLHQTKAYWKPLDVQGFALFHGERAGESEAKAQRSGEGNRAGRSHIHAK